jgi:hypothetical protein
MKTLLWFLFSFSCFAGELKVITTPSKPYTGAASTSVIKNSAGKTVATATTVNRPNYSGGGTVTTVKDSTGKISSVVTTVKNKIPGGGEISTVKKP